MFILQYERYGLYHNAALFSSRELAEEYIEKATLKHPGRYGYFRKNSLLWFANHIEQVRILPVEESTFAIDPKYSPIRD